MRFEHVPVAKLDELSRALRASGRTVARALKKLGYHSSYSHAGKFYTLVDVPRFDRNGLWFHEDVGFSQYGTLLATLDRLVRAAEAGHTHEELRSLLRLRVQNSLRGLVKAGRIGREPEACWPRRGSRLGFRRHVTGHAHRSTAV